ncbi:MAG: hypothetical protein ACO3JL_09275, partial [Myxococcota bacterium]
SSLFSATPKSLPATQGQRSKDCAIVVMGCVSGRSRRQHITWQIGVAFALDLNLISNSEEDASQPVSSAFPAGRH